MMTLLCAALAIGAPPVEAAVEGQAAPRFNIRMADKTPVKLDDLAYPGKEKPRSKKRPVFLDFFRTDCGPCRAAIPDLVKLHASWKDRGVDFFLIALVEPDDGRAKLDKFLAEKNLPFPVLIDENELYSKQYLGSTVSLPSTFLIDRDGVIVKIKRGGEGTLEKYFGSALALTSVNPAGAP